MDTVFLPIPAHFQEGMSAAELYDAARGDWDLDDAKRTDIKYAVAVVGRAIKEIYEVDGWEGANNGKWRFYGKAVQEYGYLIGLSTPQRSYGTLYYGDFSELVALQQNR